MNTTKNGENSRNSKKSLRFKTTIRHNDLTKSGRPDSAKNDHLMEFSDYDSDSQIISSIRTGRLLLLVITYYSIQNYRGHMYSGSPLFGQKDGFDGVIDGKKFKFGKVSQICKKM